MAVIVVQAFQLEICALPLKRVENHVCLAPLRDGCVAGVAVPADGSGFESADVGDVLCVLSDLVSGAEQSAEVIPLSCDECIACTFRESDRDCDIFGRGREADEVNGDLCGRVLFDCGCESFEVAA